MTLKELSRLLGLSPTTVSRALNGYPEVREATRLRVQEAARRHNYVPNTRAQGLATGRAMAVGHVIPRTNRNEVVNPVFADFVAGAGEVYAEAGYDIVLKIVDDRDEAATYQALRTRGMVDGVLVHAPRAGDPRIAYLQDTGLPFVVHGRIPEEDESYSWVDVNNRGAFYRATAFLADLGHRRIALLNGPAEMDFARRRAQGYREALAAHGLAGDEALESFDEMSEQYGYREAARLLDGAAAPTAFLASALLPAHGVRRAVEERGLALGRDVSVIAFDDDLSYLRNGGEVPLFTAVRSSVREAGRRAAAILLDAIAEPGTPARGELLEAELTVGQSTGPAPAQRIAS